MTSILSNSTKSSIDNNDTLQRFVQSKTINDVLNKVKPISASGARDLLDLPLSATMEEAFDLLLAEDILSVPIYDEQTITTQAKKYIAIVSALDLLKLLSSKVSLDTLQSNSDALLMPLKDAIGWTEPLTIFKHTDGLRQLLDCFSYEKTHRVLVQQMDGKLVLLSQMDLIRFFQAYNHQLGSSVLDLPLAEIRSSGIETSLTYRSTAAEAFLKLAGDDRISALPILDDHGDLIGEISAQDLRGLNRNRWDALLKPVVMFLKASHGDLYPPLTCHDRFTLSQVMSAFVLRQTYRLWWMGYDSRALKGIISLTDILATFASLSSSTL
ncbi:MAG: hypothetical protein EXX96DRAFT_549656 [Benjaminiella poitrasii]|nr:MAG: hypothetical protein EXX96DRAFT_549656 [Benjaminiella poitrasii]